MDSQQFNCPNCTESFQRPADAAQEVACPYCQSPISIAPPPTNPSKPPADASTDLVPPAPPLLASLSENYYPPGYAESEPAEQDPTPNAERHGPPEPPPILGTQPARPVEPMDGDPPTADTVAAPSPFGEPPKIVPPAAEPPSMDSTSPPLPPPPPPAPGDDSISSGVAEPPPPPVSHQRAAPPIADSGMAEPPLPTDNTSDAADPPIMATVATPLPPPADVAPLSTNDQTLAAEPAQAHETGEPASSKTSHQIFVPDPDGDLVAVDARRKVNYREKERNLRTLTSQEKSQTRFLKNAIVFAFCVIVLTAGLLVLIFLK